LATCALSGYSQNNDEQALLSLFFIRVTPEFVYVNDSAITKGNKILLPPGDHQIRAWTPGYKELDTTISLKAGEVKKFFYSLKRTDEYMAWEAGATSYINKKNLRIGLPAATTALLVGGTIYSYIAAKQKHQETLEKYDNYIIATANVNDLEAEFEEAQSSYQSLYWSYYIQLGALAISSYFLYKGFRWAVKNKYSDFEPAKNPFTLNSIDLKRDPYSGGLNLCLTFNLD